MDSRELAWAAGFFDGEGWSGLVREKERRTTQPQARINQADPHGVPEVLLRFQSAVGFGRVGGPYEKDGRIDLYAWHVSSRGDVELLHHLLMPWLGQVKLDKFGRALGRPSAKSRRASVSDEWIAWCGGLFDGEGSTYLLDHRSHVGYKIAEARVTQASAADAPEVLARFHHLVGVGHINGPYRQENASLLVYRWTATATRDVSVMIETLSPWLGSVKRDQARKVLGVLSSQAPLPRGRPDWGNNKTHCVHGHEYANTRIRPYVSRGNDSPPRDSHQCLQCAREQARARRAQKKSSADDGGRSVSESADVYLLK